MIAPWMLWATGLGVLLFAAAWALDHVLQLLHRPTRFAWALALMAAVAAPVVLAARRPELPKPEPAVVLASQQLSVPPLRSVSLNRSVSSSSSSNGEVSRISMISSTSARVRFMRPVFR